ncbi:hypothetical protein SLS62_001364 [Diatrype stigma]|uniref:F-box domain-containing protein n=1 Tax=Diatrype stigma TaxID=117547 RepID=A0AAN9YW23_9PEZI
MEEVLNTPELLEHILLQLKPQHLLVSAQRVSRQWHALISGSPALQSALCFRPIPNRRQEQEHHRPTRPTPLLLHRFCKLGKVFWAWGGSAGRRRPSSPEISSNAQLYRWRIPAELFWSPRHARDHLLLRNDLQEPRFAAPGASWRRMLVQRPAARSVAVCARFFEIAGRPGDRAYRLLGHSVVRYDFFADDGEGDDEDAVRMRHLVAWHGGASALLAADRKSDLLGVLFGLRKNRGGLSTDAVAPGTEPGPARNWQRGDVPVIEFLRGCLRRSPTDDEEEDEEWPSGKDLVRVDEILGTADVLLAREFDVALLPPHPNLKPRDFLLYGPKWEDLDKEDRPEPRQVAEFHTGTVEAWFEERQTRSQVV